MISEWGTRSTIPFKTIFSVVSSPEVSASDCCSCVAEVSTSAALSEVPVLFEEQPARPNANDTIVAIEINFVAMFLFIMFFSFGC